MGHAAQPRRGPNDSARRDGAWQWRDRVGHLVGGVARVIEPLVLVLVLERSFAPAESHND
jgi:hypothetical protein